MTTAQQIEQVATKVFTTMGVVTKANVVAQVEGLLVIVSELCSNFPEEVQAIDPRVWIQAASYGMTALQPVLEGELVKKLHETCRHPDWKYESVEHPRKAGYSNPPSGFGWIENDEKDRGVTRYGHTEYHHFRRSATDALKDDVDLSSLKVTPPEKMKLDEYLGKLRERFCKGYMPSSNKIAAFNSKPEYVRFVNAITGLANGNDLYCLESDAFFHDAHEITQISTQLGEYFFRDEKNEPALIYAIEINGLRILTNLGTESTFVTTTRGDGNWQKWTKWSDYLNLPIDRYTLDKILENI